MINFGSQCKPCSEHCLTCLYAYDRCTSCEEGFNIANGRCLNKHTVMITLVIDYDYKSFLEEGKPQVLTEKMASYFQTDPQDFTVMHISEGSTIFVMGYNAQGEGEQEADDMVQAITNADLSQVTGMTVLHSSVEVQFYEIVDDDEKDGPRNICTIGC